MENKKSSLSWFLLGLKNGIPICLGYFAVSFALGIAARNTGLNAMQSFLMSATMVASAGEFAAISLIGSSAGILEMIGTTFIVNMRYMLMSMSMSQKLSEDTKPAHRFFLSYCVTDEIFGLSSAVTGNLCPFYTYGITLISVSGWCLGTVLGVMLGNILPPVISGAMGVAMYGMFLAIIIPPSRENHFILALVVLSMAASALFACVPILSKISSGFRVIILTVLIAGIASIIKPVRVEE